jgi:hypothetical protein
MKRALKGARVYQVNQAYVAADQAGIFEEGPIALAETARQAEETIDLDLCPKDNRNL